MHEDDKTEIQRILDLLRILIRISGLSNREVERRLKLSPSYLSRLFGGYLEVKLGGVLQTLQPTRPEPPPQPKPEPGITAEEVERRILSLVDDGQYDNGLLF